MGLKSSAKGSRSWPLLMMYTQLYHSGWSPVSVVGDFAASEYQQFLQCLWNGCGYGQTQVAAVAAAADVEADCLPHETVEEMYFGSH